MMRCLFTDEELGPGTREEHTIQRSIGGRIRSVEVSSNEFNEKCGSLVDPVLADLYWDVMSVLGPALPSESRSGERRVDIPGQPGCHVIDGVGALKMRGAAVVAFDRITKRPAAVIGADEAAVRRIADQNIPLDAMTWQTTSMPPSFEVPVRKRPVMCPEIEIAVLKAALLSFDHLLRADADRFTRSPALQETRGFIRGCIMEGMQPDAKQLGRLVLGLQYDADYIECYRQLRNEIGYPASPFEHVLLASANSATRSVDVVFWAFRADPYAFRVCHDWDGESFIYLAVNGVLTNTSASEPFKILGGRLLGRPTRWRSYKYVTAATPSDESQEVRNDLFARRADLFREAVDHVERHFDEDVITVLQELARLNADGDHSLRSAVAIRLQIAFNSRIETTDERTRFDQIVAEVLSSAPNDVCPPRTDDQVASPIHWPLWLGYYRQCLDALRQPFGLPGDVIQTAGGEIMGGTFGKPRPIRDS